MKHSFEDWQNENVVTTNSGEVGKLKHTSIVGKNAKYGHTGKNFVSLLKNKNKLRMLSL
jgi:hypothetical protein